jgi:hypothetical protein
MQVKTNAAGSLQHGFFEDCLFAMLGLTWVDTPIQCKRKN